MTLEIVVALLLIFTLSALALLLRESKSRSGSETKRKAFDTVNRERNGTDCPLCGERLPADVRVHSTLFSGKEFDLMHIYGCSRCWAGHASPAPEGGIKERRCPYCRARLPETGYVIAQVYRKPGRKPHVHVVGCTTCKPGS